MKKSFCNVFKKFLKISNNFDFKFENKMRRHKRAPMSGNSNVDRRNIIIYYRFIVRFPIGLDFLFITFTFLINKYCVSTHNII